MDTLLEKQIVDFLIDKYHPKAILLAGSRAENEETDQSDWDLFLLSEQDHEGGFIEWESELLDVSFRTWPVEGILTIPYKPIWPVRIIYDKTNGELNDLLDRTHKTHDQGPLIAFGRGCTQRFEKLERWLTKLQKYSHDERVQFYYAGYAIEFLIRVWFEQQNLWPLPPNKAFAYIENHDPLFSQILNQFIQIPGPSRVEAYKKLLKRLRELRSLAY